MAELERTYNIPLRKGAMKAPKYMRANKAIKVVREFLVRHMKSNNVKLGPFLNLKILEHGRKNIPHHIEIKAIKNEEGIVKAELINAKNMNFLKPKEGTKEEEIKIKIPRLGKKKEELETVVEEKKMEVLSEEEKKKTLEHEDKFTHEKIEKYPEVTKDKEKDIKVKEDQVYGRLGSKKTKVKERSKTSK